MAPFRSARAARANRGQTDVDIMEGLPVRQWRKQPAVMNKNPQKDIQADSAQQNTIWREAPMPKGSELYPPWSQALLRAARAGRVLQRNSKANDEDKDGAEEEEAEGDLDLSFVANRWTQLPKESEEPDAEYLAKRKKGLPTLYGGSPNKGTSVPMRKCKVKKIDADGNSYLLEVLIPEGTTIDGEVEGGENIPVQAPAAGTVIEGLGLANAEGIIVANEHMMPTPPRRRPPIPKRKPKGPGRGRKKKVVIQDGVNGGLTAVNASGGADDGSGGSPLLNPDGSTADGERGDSAQPEGEGDEGSEDDEDDGEEGDENDRDDGELSETDDISRSASPMKSISKAKSSPKLESSSSFLEVPSTIPQLQVTPATSEVDEPAIPMEVEPVMSEAQSFEIDTEIPASTTEEATIDTTPAKLDEPMPDAPSTIENQMVVEEIPTVIPVCEPIPESESIPVPEAAPIPEVIPTAEPIQVFESIPASSELPVEAAIDIVEPTKESTDAIEAQIPEEHNPLEGLAAPVVATEDGPPQEKESPKDSAAIEETAIVDTAADTSDKTTADTTAEAIPDATATEAVAAAAEEEEKEEKEEDKVPDQTDKEQAGGEEDIFGSLERHLDGKDQ